MKTEITASPESAAEAPAVPSAGRERTGSVPAQEPAFDLPPLTELRERVDRALTAFLAGKRTGAAGKLPEEVDLLDEVARLLGGGGKRLRPALVLAAFEACGGRDREAVMPLALATELLHGYLLVHDDIMDHAETRRGEPSTHVAFRDLHRERGWSGDPEDFGRSMAILVGDLAHTLAVELAAGYLAARPAAEAEPLARVWSEMCEEVIGGQYLEMQLPFRTDPREEDLLRVLRLKSGRYTVERPLELGALAAGADEPRLAALGRYGRAVGEAFQLQDDLLGTFGDATAVGKPVGGDLAEGKRTFLVHHALEAADEAGRARLAETLGRSGLTREEVEAARRVIRESGALERVTDMIDRRLEEARIALADPDFPGPGARDLFTGLLEYSRRRRT